MERKKIEKFQLKNNLQKENNDKNNLNKSYIKNKENLIEKYTTPKKSPKKYNNNNINILLSNNNNSNKKENKKYLNNFNLTTPKKNLSPVKEIDDKNNDVITVSTNTTTPIKNNDNAINLKNYLRFNHDYYLTSAGKKKKLITMPYKTQTKIITKSSSTVNMINKNLDNKFSKTLIKNNSNENLKNNNENNNLNKSYDKNINNNEINNNSKSKTTNEKRKLINSLSLCYMLNTSRGNVKKNLDFKNISSEKNNNINIKNNIKSSRQNNIKNKLLQLETIDSEKSSRSQSKDSKININKNNINSNNNNISCNKINNKKIILDNSNLHLNPSFTKLSHNKSFQNFFKPIQNIHNNNLLYNFSTKNFNNNNYINNNSFITIEINVHDLLMVNDKFVHIMKTIESFNFYVISRSCYEFWNFYFNSSLKGNLNNYFFDINSKTEITKFNSLYLFSLLLIYDLSFNEKIFYSSYKIIKNILMLIYNTYIIICNFFLNQIQNNTNSILINKLKFIIYNNNIIDNKKILYDHNYFYENIQRNCFLINEQINLIFDLFHINNYSIKKLNPYTIKIYNNLQNYTSNDINKIFMTNILNIENKRGSVLFSNNFNNLQNKDILISEPPYKALTLILDLDETLMSFEYSNKNEGYSHIRPHLGEFLNVVHNYYEIIIFTAATQNYADPILDLIEKNSGVYFNYRLYRQHCSIYNNNFIKDISKIGRDLKYCIIVDNMSQNFKLQKDNGILIKSFWGADNNDKALLELAKILKNIAIDMINSRYKKDIRDLLWKYRDEILKNVSMN